MTDMTREELLSRFDGVKDQVKSGFDNLNKRLDEFLHRVGEVEREQREHGKKLVALETSLQLLKTSPTPKALPASIGAAAAGLVVMVKAMWEAWGVK